MSQNTRRRRQPIRERARPAQRPRIPDPQAPSDDLNKLPTMHCRSIGAFLRLSVTEKLVMAPSVRQDQVGSANSAIVS